MNRHAANSTTARTSRCSSVLPGRLFLLFIPALVATRECCGVVRKGTRDARRDSGLPMSYMLIGILPALLPRAAAADPWRFTADEPLRRHPAHARAGRPYTDPTR